MSERYCSSSTRRPHRSAGRGRFRGRRSAPCPEFEWAGAAALALSALLSALTGVFPSGTPLYVPLAVAFFLSIPAALWTHAAGVYRAGRPRDAVVGLVCGALDPAAWLVWGFVGRGVAPGLALPEVVGVLGPHTWTLYTVLSARR